jgi:hypothetical protein
MKTEEFDDAINKKLNLVNASYDEADIDKTHAYVKQHWGVSKKSFIYKLAGVSAAAMLVVGLFAWNMYERHENEKLSEQVKQFQEKPLASQTEKEDTKQTETPYSTSTNEPQIIDKNIYSPVLPIEKTYTPSNKQEERNKKTNGLDVPAANIETPTVEEPLIQVTQNDAPAETTSVANDSEANTTPPMIEAPEEKEFKKKPNLPKIKIYTYQAFVQSETFHRNMGFTLGGEILYKNKIGISTGVSMVNYEKEEFHGPDDFHKKHGRDFRDTYGNQIPKDSSRIKDIAIGTKGIRIPLQISYYLPLKKSLKLVASAGANIGVYSRSKIEYTSNENVQEEVKKFMQPEKPQFIGSFSLALGAQKQWKHLIIQGSLFSDQRLQDEHQRPREERGPSIGARARLSYTFGS